VPTGANYYAYDLQGQLIGEYDATNKVISETVYLGATPVALIKQTISGSTTTTTANYIYADQIDTPRVITRASDNKMVWRWDQADPFGLAPANENPQALGVFTSNARFPGQLYDKETNLHYNWHRDYDPQLGRYIQSDPIGLAGGVNTFGYALGNPSSLLDFDGLDVTRWERPVNFDGAASVLNRTGLTHQWLKTDSQESGMGPQTGNVPGQGNNKDAPGAPVGTKDHTGESTQSGAHKVPIPFAVDEACVNELNRPGRNLGKFIPLRNDCQTFADDVLSACRIDPKTGRSPRFLSGRIAR
jgi:RHS repeat-associated protein